jgi:hypothetical protein
MPAYEFELFNEATGKVVVTLPVILPVAQRDKLRLRRRTVPRSIAVSGAAADPHDQSRNVLRSYHRQEEKLGSRFRSAFTKDQVRRAFNE